MYPNLKMDIACGALVSLKEQKMKKFKLLAIVLAMILVLTACSGKANDDKKAKTDQSTEKTEDSAEKAGNSSEDKGDKKLVEDGVLDIGTNATFPPFEYYEGKEMVGIDIDLVKAIGEKLGLEVKIRDMEFEAIISSIESGKLDGGAAGISINPKREKSVNFTKNYFNSKQFILLNKDSDIKSLDDLKGKKLGAQMGTTSQSEAGEKFGEDKVQAFSTYQDACLAMESGKLDAVVCDEKTAENFLAANENLKKLDETLAEESYAIAIAKNNEPLKEAINKVLEDMEKSGELQKIFDKYIKKQ